MKIFNFPASLLHCSNIFLLISCFLMLFCYFFSFAQSTLVINAVLVFLLLLMTGCNDFTWHAHGVVCMYVSMYVLVGRVWGIVSSLLSKDQSSLLPQTQNVSCKNDLFVYYLYSSYLLYFSKSNWVYWILLPTQLTSVPIPVIKNKAFGNLGYVMYLQGILFAIIF